MIEDTDFSGSFCYPTCAAYERYKELYQEVVQAPITMSRISGAVTTEGLATEEEVRQILNELNEVAADRETVMSLPRIFQVWGKRANGD